MARNRPISKWVPYLIILTDCGPPPPFTYSSLPPDNVRSLHFLWGQVGCIPTEDNEDNVNQGSSLLWAASFGSKTMPFYKHCRRSYQSIIIDGHSVRNLDVPTKFRSLLLFIWVDQKSWIFQTRHQETEEEGREGREKERDPRIIYILMVLQHKMVQSSLIASHAHLPGGINEWSSVIPCVKDPLGRISSWPPHSFDTKVQQLGNMLVLLIEYCKP